MPEITSIVSREILDSRGNPTVEAEVLTASGGWGRASVPSGASTGKHEALEVRDGDKSRYRGKGVKTAVSNIEKFIAPKLIGQNVTNQSNLDRIMIELDGTATKNKLGANSILPVSLACARSAASHLSIPLYQHIGGPNVCQVPLPMMNLLNGGAHADNSVEIQEFMVVPANGSTFQEILQMGVEVFHYLGQLLKKQGLSTSVGDEGGYAPNLDSDEQGLELILESIEKSGFHPGRDMFLALDVAATELWDNHSKNYRFRKINRQVMTSNDLIELYAQWCKNYPILSIEDGLAEDDWEGWRSLTEKLGSDIHLVGDDLFVTNLSRLKQGIEQGAGNSILIKLNQIGTLTETLETVEMAKKHGFTPIISHRSGETEDTFISDLAVGCSASMIKAGSGSRTDRICKYNQLLRIEEELGSFSLLAPKPNVSSGKSK